RRKGSWGSRARSTAVFSCDGVMRRNEATTDMANTPKKMKDPTEAALSAIQDALHLKDDEEPAAQTTEGSAVPVPARAEEAPNETSWPFRKSSVKSDL